ncbi:serine/threonine-protein kinase dyf-5-like [Sycon ciliatum]|uniref:serine/threonine-protein kinase dyf-5-like n=1 Tax=Sycon ciliatum TaxID=27933 RepID=UPI0031F638BD
MDNYRVIRPLGDGSFGVVSLATSKKSGGMVAIKKFKQGYKNWQEVIQLSEVKSLRALKHINIVKLIELFRQDGNLYMVFEYMKSNLYELLKDRKSYVPETTVRNIMYQILSGLSYMHLNGYFHRDLKPENILCSGVDNIKLADFGLAREIRSRPPYSDYISTRWYRAPEVILRSKNYNSPIDLWAIGAIMAEVYKLKPLFAGSSELDQLYKICLVLGQPTQKSWKEGFQLAATSRIKFPATPSMNSLDMAVTHASREGLELMYDLLKWDPKQRITAPQALQRKFFLVGTKGSDETGPPQATRTMPGGVASGFGGVSSIVGENKPARKPAPRQRRDSDDDDFDWTPPGSADKETTAVDQPAGLYSKLSQTSSFRSPNQPQAHGGAATSAYPFPGAPADDAQPRMGALNRKEKELPRRESVQSIVSNSFALGGTNASVSAANYYVAKSRYTPVSGGSRIPKSKIALSHQPSVGRLHQQASKVNTFTLPSGAGESAQASSSFENRWSSRPSYQQLDLGFAKHAKENSYAHSSRAPTMPLGMTKANHRTDWSAKYGGRK